MVCSYFGFLAWRMIESGIVRLSFCASFRQTDFVHFEVYVLIANVIGIVSQTGDSCYATMRGMRMIRSSDFDSQKIVLIRMNFRGS